MPRVPKPFKWLLLLSLIAAGTWTGIHWEFITDYLGESYRIQAEKTQTTLFRLGELKSITA